LRPLELARPLVLTTLDIQAAEWRCHITGFGLKFNSKGYEMRTLVKLAITAALALVLPAVALAQMDQIKNSTPEQRAEMQDKWMKSNLSLDAKTSESLAAINLKYAKETQALVESPSPNFKKLMTFRSNSKAKDAEIKADLTPEQYSLYEQKKSEMEAQIKQKLQEKHQVAQSN
jgi:hypothetical protein